MYVSNKMLLAELQKIKVELEELKSKVKSPSNTTLLTYEQAAAMLNISVEGLRTRIKRKQIKRTCNGGRPGVMLSEVHRYLNEQNPKQ